MSECVCVFNVYVNMYNTSTLIALNLLLVLGCVMFLILQRPQMIYNIMCVM